MQESQHTISWLEHLMVLLPPSGHILIGAGTGRENWVSYLVAKGCHHVTLVEADHGKFSHLQRATANQPDWQLCDQLIAAEEGPAFFHHASATRESGLLEAEVLRRVWPNLHTTRVESRHAVTLVELLSKSAHPANWLWVDCLPALSILSGQEQALNSMDVIMARVIVNANDPMEECAALLPLQEFLGPYGFRLVSLEEDRNPTLGYALFVRGIQKPDTKLHDEWAKADQTHAEDRELQAEQLSESQVIIQALRNELEKVRNERTQAGQGAMAAEQKHAEDRELQAEQLSESQVIIQALRNELEKVGSELTQAGQGAMAADQKHAEDRELQAKQLRESQEIIQALRNELEKVGSELTQAGQGTMAADQKHAEDRELLAKQLRESQEIIQALRNELEKVRNELTQAGQGTMAADQKHAEDRELLAEQLRESQEIIQALRNDLQKARDELKKAEKETEQWRKSEGELMARQKIMDNELTRAIAQIDLIKGLILNDLAQ